MKSGHKISSGLLGCYVFTFGLTAFAAPELSDLETWEDLPTMKMSKDIPDKSTSSDFYLNAGQTSDSHIKEPSSSSESKAPEMNFPATHTATETTPPYMKDGDDPRESSFSFARKETSKDALTPVPPINSIQHLEKEPQTNSPMSSDDGSDSKKQKKENSRKLFESPEESTTGAISSDVQAETHLTTTSIFGSVFIASILFLVLWYQKQLKGKLRANQGLPIETLGQTWLDGQTKIIILRIGSKVLILAKSPSFCTTLDTITDPEEVNLLTLGSGTAGKEDFSKLLTQIKNQAGFGKKSKDIPHESEIRSELDQLKQQLGSIGQQKS